jgi:hypothetical protein
MKQAVRENRRGKVRVPEYLILDASPEVALLRSRMEVCEILPDFTTAGRWFIGYAPEFNALELGVAASSPMRCLSRGDPALRRRGRQSGRDRGIRTQSRALAFRPGIAVDPRRLPVLRLRPGVPAAPGPGGRVPAKTEAIKDEAIRRGLKKAEGQFWKLALSPPGQSNRTDKSRLLAVLGISESEYISRFTSPTQTDWVMRCTAKKVLRTVEQEPVVLPPAKAQRAA